MKKSKKNRQTLEQLQQIMKKTFKTNGLISATELDGGSCNITYEITLNDGKQVILKIAPKTDELLMFHEKNRIYSEVNAMKLAKAQTPLPIPEIYCYDHSKTVCNADYFIMEKMVGKSYDCLCNELNEETQKKLLYKQGQMLAQLHKIKGNQFGFFSQPEHWNNELFNMFYFQMESLLNDAKNKNIVLPASNQTILKQLLKDAHYFKDNIIPTFIHWDSWDGNFLIKNDEITGLIDWEWAAWGDPLMEERFRRHCLSEDFLKGYQIISFSPKEKIRLFWYDCFLYILMITEYYYKENVTEGLLQWATKLLEEVLEQYAHIKA